jgi:hypothetical protein
MAPNRWKVLALGSLHAHPSRGDGVPALPRRRDRPLAARAAQATASRRTRGGSADLVVSGCSGPGGERHSRASVPLFSAPLGAPDARRGRARPDATLSPVPRHAGQLRRGRHARGVAPVPAPALRRHPCALALSPGAARLGRATGPPCRARHDLLRSGSALDQDGDAVFPRVPEVGGAALRSGGGDLVVHGERSARARTRADRGDPLHHEPPRFLPRTA